MVARKAARKINNKNNTEQRKATAKKATEAAVQSAEEVVMATEEETVEEKAVETVEEKAVETVEKRCRGRKEDRREESSKKSSSEKGDEDFCSSRIQGKTGRRKRDDRGSEKSVDKIWTSDR